MNRYHASCALFILGSLVGCSSDDTPPGWDTPDPHKDAGADGAGGSPGTTPPGTAHRIILADRAGTMLPSFSFVNGGHAVFADLDGDTFPDIAQPTDNGIRLFWNDGKKFTAAASTALPKEPEETTTHQLVAADFDGDGFLDLLAVGKGKTPLRLLTHKSDKSFSQTAITLPEGKTPRFAVVADVDRDGDPDVLILLEAPAGTSSGALLLINDGKGTLTDQTASRLIAPSLNAYGAAFGDVDGDGKIDLFFSGDKTGHRLLLNDGNGTFRDAAADALPMFSAPQGRFPVFGDIDGDGALDIVIPSALSNQILINDGKGKFTDGTAFRLGANAGTGNVAVVADLDGDKVNDVIIAGPNSPFKVLRNDGAGRLFDYSANVFPWTPEASDVVSIGVADVDGDKDLDLFISRTGLARPWLLVNWYPGSMDDKDGDGVPDEIDNCPKIANPDQSNIDSFPFACMSGRDCRTRLPGCELAVGDGDKSYLACAGPMSWDDARAFCRSRGAGDLVIIKTKEENEFLTSIAPDTFWIGLSDTKTAGTFVWVDGTSPSTTFWAEGEPNNSGGVEHCGGIYTTGDNAGRWNDFNCDSGRAFICQDKAHDPPDPGDACDVCPNVYDPDQKVNSDGDGLACTATTETEVL